MACKGSSVRIRYSPQKNLIEPLLVKGFFFYNRFAIIITKSSQRPLKLKFGSGIGQKSLKGTVSIQNADGRINLGWRYQFYQYVVFVFAHNLVLQACRESSWLYYISNFGIIKNRL